MRNTLAFLLFVGMAVGVAGPGDADAGICPPGYEEVAVGDSMQCAHPDGVPFKSTRPTSFYAIEAEARALDCFGSGTDGNRLQAVFVTDGPATLTSVDRSAISQGMVNVQSVYRTSSRAVADVDLVPRWVHSSDCEPSIEVVQVAPEALAEFAATIQAVSDQGHNRPDRKYIMWTDSSVYCGIAAVSIDDSKTENRNDGHHPGFARIDRGCWGYQGSVIAHEVTHTLGAVQPTAPNATPYGHCTDEYDLMCYVDGPGVDTSIACSSQRGELLLDCNNDDYFHPDPPPGSWLYSHWNVADSSFVERIATNEPVETGIDGEVAPGFVDVDQQGPHARAIGWLADRGVTRGCDVLRFCPDRPVTRGQMAAFLHRFVPDLPVVTEPTGFEDVSPGEPFSADVAWLLGTGLTRGCDETRFCPDQVVSRGQMAAFLYRVFAAGAVSGEAVFADVGDDSPFRTEIAWLAEMGISNGCGNSAFCPDATVTRAQMASFLHRAGEIYFDE